MDQQASNLERLRFDVSRGLLVGGLRATEGWRLLEDELKGMVEAYKRRAVDPKIIGQPYEHAAIVGAHNAIQSLLDLLDTTQQRGKAAEMKLEKAEDEQRDQDATEHKFRRS